LPINQLQLKKTDRFLIEKLAKI